MINYIYIYVFFYFLFFFFFLNLSIIATLIDTIKILREENFISKADLDNYLIKSQASFRTKDSLKKIN